MSNDSGNLRLLGSPVNLSYRSKKKDDRKNIRNRPRSALQTFNLTPPESQEKYKRPFSADAKVRTQSTRQIFKAYSSELLQSCNGSPTTIKIVAPTTDLLRDAIALETRCSIKEKDICSNASDHGSEDTYISLGTKIKAKAQLSPKPKPSNSKNFLKYRNIARKGRKTMEDNVNEGNKDDYGMEIKITEKPQSPAKNESIFREMSPVPKIKNTSFESYFIPLNDVKENLLGRVSFGPNLNTEVEEAIDTYSRRLTVTRQQLSLVEEESTQDVDSVPSQNLSSLSPENSVGDKNDNFDENLMGHNYVLGAKVVDGFKHISQDYICETRYSSFYDNIHSDLHKNKMSSTLHTDSSSKDSGYPDSAANEISSYKQSFSLPTTSFLKKSSPHTGLEDQPKSLDSTTSNKNVDFLRSYPLDKGQWSEPLNHSRLLYKDFFLRKEGHIALPPHNSPCKTEVTVPGISEESSDKNDNGIENLEYPPYLVNSATKAYTSKVIEDYKRELQAINNLHELTIKDIKVDAVSPTPLNLEKMFEETTTILDIKKDNEDLQDIHSDAKDKNSLDLDKRDVSKISTKELIQNYLRVKEGDFKNSMPKNLKRGQKINNIASRIDEYTAGLKQDWNNKTYKTAAKPIPVNNIRNPMPKNMFTIHRPLSARLDGVHNDKDVDSWMSLSAPSPRILEIETASDHNPAENEPIVLETKVEIVEGTRNTSSPEVMENKKSSELNSNSTVLDIYSMLKEIESYGDTPVASSSVAIEVDKNTEERLSTPKDNFMEIFEFLEKVEQSANDALSVVTNNAPQSTPKLEILLKLPQTELAQRLVTASLQLEERSCCIALLQESLANHKEQMINKVSNLEKQSLRNVAKVKQECEDSIKKHQNFIDQLINDKKTLNHRIEQLVDERRSLEERWKRSAQTLEERYKLELKNQHDKMAAAQQVARQRWVRQKAEKIKELTVKGLEGELREMAERQQKEISDLKMAHAEQMGRVQAKHAQEIEDLRKRMDDEREVALIKERQMASSRLEKQILELELTYQEQRTRLVAEMRAENERVAAELAEKEKQLREDIEKWKQEQEKLLEEKKLQMESAIAKEKEKNDDQIKQRRDELEREFEKYKKQFEAEQQLVLKRKVTEISAQHKQERDREIEKAIESMEAEAQAGRKELQEALRRNKEQYEVELKELAETEQATLRRYQDAQARVRQTEDRCAELEVTISQLETRNRVLIEKNNQLESRAEEVRASCEESWTAKVESLKKDIEEMKKTHEEQMHQLYAKVKVAVARKDSAIQALTREAGKYQEKITLLEQKLQQQRKDFLKQK